MAAFSNIFQKVCPSCAVLLGREDEQCACGHSFVSSPPDTLAEEQLYHEYLEARAAQAEALAAVSRAEAQPLPPQLAAEMKAVQAELDRQRARMARLHPVAPASPARSSVPAPTPRLEVAQPQVGGKGSARRPRVEGGRVRAAAQELEQELARLRRGWGNPFGAAIAAKRQERRPEAHVGRSQGQEPVVAALKAAASRPVQPAAPAPTVAEELVWSAPAVVPAVQEGVGPVGALEGVGPAVLPPESVSAPHPPVPTTGPVQTLPQPARDLLVQTAEAGVPSDRPTENQPVLPVAALPETPVVALPVVALPIEPQVEPPAPVRVHNTESPSPAPPLLQKWVTVTPIVTPASRAAGTQAHVAGLPPPVPVEPVLPDVRARLAVEADAVARRQRAERRTECPHCTAAVPASAMRCSCGFELPAQASRLPSVRLDAAERFRLAAFSKSPSED